MKCVLSFVFVTVALLQFAAAAPVVPGLDITPSIAKSISVPGLSQRSPWDKCEARRRDIADNCGDHGDDDNGKDGGKGKEDCDGARKRWEPEHDNCGDHGDDDHGEDHHGKGGKDGKGDKDGKGGYGGDGDDHGGDADSLSDIDDEITKRSL